MKRSELASLQGWALSLAVQSSAASLQESLQTSPVLWPGQGSVLSTQEPEPLQVSAPSQKLALGQGVPAEALAVPTQAPALQAEAVVQTLNEAAARRVS